MWRAWIGFNFSHSLGLLLFAALAAWAGFRVNTLPVGIMPVLTLFGCIYLILAHALPVSHPRHRRCNWYRRCKKLYCTTNRAGGTDARASGL
jgi:hypothetical protein